ncbi:MAG: DUF364 domain-containing protein [Ruthenibacterium sp.]
MWELYDALLRGISQDAPRVETCCGGRDWTSVKAGAYAGAAMLVSDESRPPLHPESFCGGTLHEMAACVKSWNFAEASLGAAAINAWYNSPQTATHGIITGKDKRDRDAFMTYQQEITGKKVAVVGHFPFLETRFAPLCELSILERAPQNGDYPDSACEYLLPAQDYVFITGVTLINKTLPRLLELAKKAKIVLVGPSVPLAPCLFDFGVDALESFVLEQPEAYQSRLLQNPAEPIFHYGSMVSLTCNLN